MILYRVTAISNWPSENQDIYLREALLQMSKGTATKQQERIVLETFKARLTNLSVESMMVIHE